MPCRSVAFRGFLLVFLWACTVCAYAGDEENLDLLREWAAVPSPETDKIVLERELSFIGDSVALLELRRTKNVRLRARSKDSSYSIWIARFDENGRQSKESHLLSPSDDIKRVFELPGDRLLLWLDSSVFVLTKDLELVWSRDLAPLKEQAELTGVEVAPNGETFFVMYAKEKGPATVEQYETADFRKRRVFRLADGGIPASMSNEWLVFSIRHFLQSTANVVLFNFVDQTKREFKVPVGSEGCGPRPLLLKNGHMFAWQCSHWTFFNQNGEKERSANIRREGSTDRMTTAFRSSRFVVRVTYLSSGSVSTSEGESSGQEIMVLDGERQERLAALRIKGGGRRELTATAFSSDGNRIAVWQGDRMRIYAIKSEAAKSE